MLGRVMKEVYLGPRRARIRKNEKLKIRGGGICAPRAKHGIVPKLSSFGSFLILNLDQSQTKLV